MNKNRYILAVTLSLAVAVALGAVSAHLVNRNTRYVRALESANRRSLAQLSASISSIDTGLQKLQYAAYGPTYTALSADIWRESACAKQALAALPLYDARLERFETFIAQAGDYAFALMKASAGGAPSGDETAENLKSLSAAASQLSGQMSVLSERLDAQDVYISLQDEGDSWRQPQGAPVDSAFSQTEEEFPEYATLIYDGPFSEHVKSLTPRFLEDKAEVSLQQAEKAALAFLSRDAALTPRYEGDGLIPYYCFGFDENGTVQVSKAGGVVFSLYDCRELSQGKLSVEEALEKAGAFLSEQGYSDMQTSYYTVYENILTINFAATEGDVVLYPDLIKVGIALDDGQVVRFDGAGYLMNHRARDGLSPTALRDDIWSALPAGLEVVSENTALIPTSGKNEVLCFEFVCEDAEGRHVILYYNAETGAQENIFLLVEDERGVLTV